MTSQLTHLRRDIEIFERFVPERNAERKQRIREIEEFEKKMADTLRLFNYIIDLKENKNSKNALFLKEMGDMIGFALKQIDNAKANFSKKS